MSTTDRDKLMWLEGHYAGLAAAAIVALADQGALPESNEAFMRAFKGVVRDDTWRVLDEATTNAMYNIWRSEKYEKLVEEYFDEQG